MNIMESEKAELQASEEYTIEKLRKAVDSIFAAPKTDIYLFFLLNADGEDSKMELRRIDFTDKIPESVSMGEDMQLKGMYRKRLEEMLQDSNAELRNLSDCDGNPHNVYLCDEGQLPDELSLFSEFCAERIFDNSHQIPKFEYDKDGLSKLYGYIAYIGTMYQGMVLFTKHYPVTLIRREAFLLGFVNSNKRFERVNDGDLLRISGKTHLLSLNGYTFVLDMKAFERDMGYKELTTQKAKEIVKEIEGWEFVDQISDLREIANDFRLAQKLVRARKYSPIFLEEPDWPTVLAYIQKTQPLKDLLKLDDTKKKVVLSTAKARKAFISLLDDDFLQSELTHSLYRAPHKKTVSTPSIPNPKEDQS